MSRKTERACQQHADSIMAKANVVGVAGGPDEVLVFVTAKKPLSELDPGDVVPDRVSGVETDVVEVGPLRAMLEPGRSIGLRQHGTGTLGAVVEDRDGRRWGLTNAHVTGTNRATVLTPVHSPGPADGLGPRIGRLGRHEPILFTGTNLVDAALIRLDAQPARTHPRTTLTPRVGWKVTKVGRTTGRTTGTVLGRDATFDIDFGDQGTARFAGCIVTSYMLDPGDSGSVLTTVGGFACGLCFAGSDTVSLALPIRRVLDTLAVRM